MSRTTSRRSSTNNQNTIMIRSLDPSTLSRKTSTNASDDCSSRSEIFDESVEKRMTRSAHYSSTLKCSASGRMPRSPKSSFTNGEPLPTSTALVPAPESLISPSMAPFLPFHSNPLSQKTITTVEDDEELCPAKLMTIKTKACKKLGQVRNSYNEEDLHRAAICIQKVWRGYRARTLNRQIYNAYQKIQSTRFNQYIKKLSVDMEATRVALDKEHQLQVLQMEAINALWKKISTLQVNSEVRQNATELAATEKINLKTLVITCSQLDSQVQKLQDSMQEILQRINTFSRSNNQVSSTQTEIIAVHTPSDDIRSHFPYQKISLRPSSLPLSSVNSNHLSALSRLPVQQSGGNLQDCSNVK